MTRDRGFLRSRRRAAQAAAGGPQAREKLLRMMPTGSVCAEIGVWKGDFSQTILEVVRPKRLHLVDPWHFEPDPVYQSSWYGGNAATDQDDMDRIHRGVLERFRAARDEGVVVVHRSSSADAAAEFEEGYFDWVYIDGNHLYDFVKEDLELYEGKVALEGRLAGDDYGDPGWWEDGVRRAVDEFAASRGYPLRTFATQFVIERTPSASGQGSDAIAQTPEEATQ